MTKICCVCSKVERNGNWVADRFNSATDRLTHGYCPACYDDVMKDLGRMVKTREPAGSRTARDASNKDRPEVCAF